MQVDIKSMKICWSGAAPLMQETKQRFESLTGGWLLEAYGMTETMLAAIVCPVHAPYKPGSTGLPLPDVDVRIVDAETGQTELPLGQVGELTIRAPQVMEGYWNRPEETATILRDGVVYTGDLGYVDEDGYVFIVDRKKDLIKPASGFQVWPREVEEVIATHPGRGRGQRGRGAGRHGQRAGQGLDRAARRPDGHRRGDHRLLPRQAGRLQGAAPHRVPRHPAQEHGRQGPAAHPLGGREGQVTA